MFSIPHPLDHIYSLFQIEASYGVFCTIAAFILQVNSKIYMEEMMRFIALWTVIFLLVNTCAFKGLITFSDIRYGTRTSDFHYSFICIFHVNSEQKNNFR